MPREYCPRCAAEVPVDDGICFFGHDVSETDGDPPAVQPLEGSRAPDEEPGGLEELAGAVAAGEVEPGDALSEVGDGRERGAEPGGEPQLTEGLTGEEADADGIAVGAERPTDDGPSIDPNAFTARSGKRRRGLLSRLFG